MLLHEEFLQFDWLRAIVFQLNLKYLHVKITVSILTKITRKFKNNGGKISRFSSSRDSRTEAKFIKPKHEEKYDNLAECLGRKQEF